MAGEASGSFLPLEVTGSGNGKALTFGNSGETNVLPKLAASGAAYRHMSGAMTAPMQTFVVTMGRMGASFSAAMTAPMQTVAAHGGMRADLTTPMQKIAATGTVPILARAALTAPMQVVYGHSITGVLMRAALMNPMPVASMRIGNRADLTAPMQRLLAHMIVGNVWQANLIAPLARVAATMSVYSYPFRAALVNPMIVAGPYGIARLLAPMSRMSGTFVLPATFEGWALNVRNNGATRWTNYPFTQFANAGGATYAVGADGNLYLLGGDLDNTAPISWMFETGLDDLGSPGVKHIPYLYLDAIIDGEIQIVLLDDRGREFAYEYDTKDRGAVHMTHKRKLGNGIRTRNAGFRILSTTGAYIELDSLEPEATVTQRSI